MYKIKEYPELFYHLTPISNVVDIMSSGLNPKKTKSSLQAVFLALNESIAEAYSSMYDQEETVLLKIHVSGLNEDLMGPDNYELVDYLWDHQTPYDHWSDVPALDSLRYCGQIAYYGIIPAESIEKVR